MRLRLSALGLCILLHSMNAWAEPDSVHAPHFHLLAQTVERPASSRRTQPAPLKASAWEGARAKAWIPLLLGGALVVEGLVLRKVASDVHADLNNQRDYIREGERTSSAGRTYEWLGTGSIIAGSLALGASALMFFLDPPGSRASALIAPVRGGAVATFVAPLP